MMSRWYLVEAWFCLVASCGPADVCKCDGMVLLDGEDLYRNEHISFRG